MTGEILGTPNYMSPDQVVNSNVDHRADIYSLGVVLWELLARRQPFEGSSVVEILSAKNEALVSALKVNPNVPHALDAVALRATKGVNPSERYQTAAAMAQDLRQYLR